MNRIKEKCDYRYYATATAARVGREVICNYHDMSWRFLILEAEQDAEAKIRHQFDERWSLVIGQQLEKTYILHQQPSQLIVTALVLSLVGLHNK